MAVMLVVDRTHGGAGEEREGSPRSGFLAATCLIASYCGKALDQARGRLDRFPSIGWRHVLFGALCRVFFLSFFRPVWFCKTGQPV